MKPGAFAAALAAAVLLAGCGGEKPASEPVAATVPAAAPSPDANAPAVEPVTPVDYSKPEAWLCRPDVADACKQVATATVIAPDGKLTKDRFAPDPNPPIDCFYVYPAISRDETPNSDIVAGDEEREVARQQVARFGSVCRIYAPMYRQVTLSALRQMLAGKQPANDREMAYADVKAAWEYYLANSNAGRGVVLIGHGQGAGVLTRLIAAEIDGKPSQQKLISAILPGTNLAVGDPHEGGTFRNIPLCATAESTSCVISWVSFRADTPPPANTLFGTTEEQGQHAACVNPAELDGSNGLLKAMLPAGPVLPDLMAAPGPWTTDNAAIETPFVMLPGMLSAACVRQGPLNYLAVTIAADPADKRTDTIVGDMVVDGSMRPEWGLHLIDMHLAMGNLVEIVRRQAAEWKRLQSNSSSARPSSPKPN